MEAAPYYAPTYFPASYFYVAAVAASSATGLQPYNAPTYFPPSYFYGPSSAAASTTGLQFYNAPTYFPPSYFYGPSSVAASTTGLQPYNAPTYFPPSYFYGPSAAASSTGLQPYNAPTYFPPSYFYGPSSAASTTGLQPYNTPTYFSTSYFYGPSSEIDIPRIPEPDPVPDPVPDPTPDPVPDPDGCDHDSYSALLELIKATGVFEDVIFGASNQRSQAGADTYPLAVLTPRGWEECDDFDPTSIVRRVTFSITIVVKSQEDVPKFDELDRLSFIVKRFVDRSNLDGTSLPALTKIRSGQFRYSNHYPEQSIELEGEFSSIIDPLTNVPVTS